MTQIADELREAARLDPGAPNALLLTQAADLLEAVGTGSLNARLTAEAELRERARIVEWLRKLHANSFRANLATLALAIENGEHRT